MVFRFPGQQPVRRANMGKEAKYVVRLSNEERGQLENLVARGRVAKATRQRAQVLLRADQGQEGPCAVDEAIADLVGVSLSTVHRVRQQFVEEGLEASLYRKPATNRQYRKLDGVQEAHLVALACSSPPTGRVCWTMQLLADKLVELEIVESIGRDAVRTTLKKTFFSPGAKSNGCCRRNKTPILSARWKTCSKSTNGPTIRRGRSCVLTSKAGN
jgi:transposase